MGGLGDALTKGEGTPWGPKTDWSKQVPQVADYLNDPSKYQSFDTSELANRASADIYENVGNSQARNLGRLAQMGAGRSAGANRLLQNTQATGDKQMGDLKGKFALQGWQDKLSQMAQENAFNLNSSGLEMDAWKTAEGLKQADKASRRGMLSKAFGPVGDVFNLFGNS